MESSYGLEIPRSLEEVCTPKRTALVVYDMQVGVIQQISDGAVIVARVQTVVQAARAAGMRIFFMRHMSLPRELMGVFQLRIAMSWQRVKTVADVRPWFLRDSPGFSLVPELTPRPSEAILDKITMSAFEGTPLGILPCVTVASIASSSQGLPWKSASSRRSGTVLTWATFRSSSRMPAAAAMPWRPKGP